MKTGQHYKPPRLAIAFFRWFCHSDLREEIEGDMLERFHSQAERYGLQKAKWLFVKEVLLLFRPALIKNAHHLFFIHSTDMKIFPSLLLASLLLITLIISPFFPGPSNPIVVGLSSVSLTLGFFGLLLIPVGAIWVIAEWLKLRQSKDQPVNWKPSFYLAIIATMIATSIALIYVPFLWVFDGVAAAIAAAVLIGLGLYKVIRSIKKLRTSPQTSFNPIPLYLIILPLIAFTTNKVLTGPMSVYSRNIAIQKSQALIDAIELYKVNEGEYPPSLENLQGKYLHKLPKPAIMGIKKYQYNKINDQFTLSFSQWKDGASLEEIVIFDKNPGLKNDYAHYDYKIDRYRVKGAFASYDTGVPHWRYYLCD